MTKIVTVFGGTGFIGRYVVALLAKQGWLIRVVVRRQDRGLFLKPLGSLGQITIVAADVNDPDSLARILTGSTAVINLLGILYQRRKQNFQQIHVEVAENIAKIAAKNGVRQFIHLSALGADKNSLSQYAKTKAEGEQRVRQYFPQAVILRPSIVFGPEDRFFNRFARLARYTLFLPLICPKTKFQPVFVQDVAQAVIQALIRSKTAGHVYELGGPAIYTFHDLWRYILRVTNRSRVLVRIPLIIAKPMAWLMGLLPNPLLTLDQLRLLQVDNIVSKQALSLSDLNVQAASVEKIVPDYLYLYQAKPLKRFAS